MVDTSGNGQIGLTDLTPIGINYASRVDGYHVYKADGPDPATANCVQVAVAPFSASTLTAGTRRRFGVTVPSAGLAEGAYYFVRPYETVTAQEGAASNVLVFHRTQHVKFYLPGSGDYIVDGSQCQDPSLVLMPPVLGVSEPGAPVIVYTTLGGGGGLSPLMLGYFGESGWVTEEIGGGGNYTMGQALFVPGAGGDPGAGLAVAYDIAGAKVVERRFDGQWMFVSSADVGAGSGAFTGLALDRDPATGVLGLAQAYSGLGTGSVLYSSAGPGGPWSTQPVYDGEAIGGLAFKFDPAGGDPWLLFTHGTTSATTGLITLDYSLEQGRLHTGAWNITAVPHPDSPLEVDLGFRTDGTPQLVCTAARDFTLNIPGLDPWTISMLYDVVTAEYAGAGWTFQQAYESGLGFSFEGFPLPTTLVLQLNLATDAAWAKADELAFAESAGNIKLNLSTYLPEDGGLATDAKYMKRQSGAFYTEAGYYSGATGRARNWQTNATGQPVCAYVRSTSISAADIIGGNFAAAGELSFLAAVGEPGKLY